MHAPRINPELSYEAAGALHKPTCVDLIRSHGYTRICDVGGGRAPLFSLDEIRELGLEYTVLDIEAEELALLPDGYRTLQADISDGPVDLENGGFDLVLSKMLAEHVPDGEGMHRSVLRMLRPGGRAFHFFPTLYDPIFVANWVMPESLSSRLFWLVSNRQAPKFPARYSWCRGPSRAQIARLVRVGWEVELYRPFYGTDYLNGVPVVRDIGRAFAAWAAKRRNPHLTSYAFVVLKKPAVGADGGSSPASLAGS